MYIYVYIYNMKISKDIPDNIWLILSEFSRS